MKDLLDRLYRQNAGALTASLTRLFGPRRLDAVEAVLHDTFVAALEAWQRGGGPGNPAPCLITVARNRAFDVRKGERRRGDSAADLDEVEDRDANPTAGASVRGEVADDELRMMFVA